MSQISSDHLNQHSSLNEKKYLSRDNTLPDSNKSINIYNLKNNQISNIFKRYTYSSIFEKREKNFKSKKLKSKFRNNSFSIRKSDGYSTSQNSIYITQNPSIVEFSQLPLILEKKENESIKDNKMKRIINIKKLFRKKIKNDINISCKEKNLSTKNIRNNNILIYKRKKNVDKENNENLNKSANLIKNKNLYELNRFRTVENSKLTYMEKLRDFINSKMLCNFKKERILRLEEFKYNEFEAIKNKIYSLNKSQDLMDNDYMIKCREYILKLYKIVDNLENKDNIFFTKVMKLEKEIKLIERKISEKINERKIYIKWMIFLIQIKEKLLKPPKKYERLLESHIKLPSDLEIYKKDSIYPTPEDLMYQFEAHKNKNINLMKICQKIVTENNNLKMELEKKIKINQSLSKIEEEVNILIQRRDKVKSRYQLLTNQFKSIYEQLYSYTDSDSDLEKGKKGKVPKIYQKIKIMKSNLVKKKPIEPLFKTKEKEMLYILKEIEFVFYREREIYKYYLENNKDDIDVALLQISKEKRIESVIFNKNLLYEKKLRENKRIMEKANRKILLPTIKVNWDIFKMPKRKKSVININNLPNEDDEIEKNFELIQYE